MTESKPNIFRMTLMGLSLFLMVGLTCLLIVEWVTEVTGMNMVIQTLLTIFAIFSWYFFIILEVPIILALTIDDDKILVKNLLTRKSKEVLFENIHSFKISIQIGRYSGFWFDLILLRHGEAVESIPLVYIHNLDQIIKELEKHLRNSTQDEYGLLRYVRETE